ncbi:MAG TPA: 4Fe-4S dicluster domain-containing protein [Euryarchaeota archaeon]|nr:MAG: hypothetical protein DRN52_07495 [Thermococci archaeon]HDI10575.1 4Fe-4S dicluster domain-containing protein [Euryarchaeota archaeon]
MKSERFLVEVKREFCKGCGVCSLLCPMGVISMEFSDAKRIAVPSHQERCTGCRYCEEICPDFAISIKRGI